MAYVTPSVLKREHIYVESPSMDAFAHEQKRKRTRTMTRSCTVSSTLTASLDTPVPLERHERRRVNPEALALRLGSELVKELDALIAPGSIEMPPFAARREIQVKYNVDRRHIYDYYHAKGLRVVKEGDKSNSTPVKEPSHTCDDPGNMHTLRPIRALPLRRITAQRSAAEASPPRPVKKVACPQATSAYHNQNSHLPALVHASSTFSTAAPSGDFSYQPLVFHCSELDDSTQLPPALEHGHQDHDYPLFDVALSDAVNMREHLNFDYGEGSLLYEDAQEFNAQLPDLTFAATVDHDSETSSNQTLSTPPPLDLCDLLQPEFAADSPMLPLDNHNMTQNEREESYMFFSYAVGPSSGVQESIGSYMTFMKTQTREHSDNLEEPQRHDSRSPVSAHSIHVPTPPASCALFGDRPQPTPEEQAEDFKKWLMPSRRREQVALGHPPPLPGFEKATSDSFGCFPVQCTSSPLDTEMTAPSLDEIFAPDRQPPPSQPPPIMTTPNDFYVFPDADFHIHGVPIISHNKPQLQQPPEVSLSQAPGQAVDLLLPPPYFSATQPWPEVEAAMQGVEADYEMQQYSAAHGLAALLSGDENVPPYGMPAQPYLLAPTQQVTTAYAIEVPGCVPPLHAPAPSRPRLGWLGIDQGRSISGRLRGISASGDL